MAETRILQVVASNQRRGAEVFASQLEPYLAERNMSVTTVALRGTDDSTRLPYEVVGDGRRFSARSLRQLIRFMRSADLTIVHGSDGLLPVAALAPVLRRPFIYRNIGDPDYWAPSRGAQLRVGAPLRRAAAVVALYDTARRSMIERYRLDPTRIVTSANGVDEQLFPSVTELSRSEARAELGIDTDAVVVGFLGALSPEKQPELAVRAVGRLDGVELLIAGTGQQRAQCEELAQREAPNRVRFLGQVANANQFLHSLDALVLTSTTEGLPGVVIEAALAGIPVVATPVGGVPELIDTIGGGQVVTTVNPATLAKAIDEVLTSPELHRADRSEVVRRYGIEAVGTTWAELVSRLTNSLRS